LREEQVRCIHTGSCASYAGLGTRRAHLGMALTLNHKRIKLLPQRGDRTAAVRQMAGDPPSDRGERPVGQQHQVEVVPRAPALLPADPTTQRDSASYGPDFTQARRTDLPGQGRRARLAVSIRPARSTRRLRDWS
jgi:hypothetical protein